MNTLAKGKSGELTATAIRELLIAMQGTHHNTFDDDTDVKDIADLLRINVWNDGKSKKGSPIKMRKSEVWRQNIETIEQT